MATVNGTSGSDTLTGTSGNDTINGWGGNDTLTGGGGNDTLRGGTGTDTFIFSAGDGEDVIADLAAGETVQVNGYASAQSITQSGTSVIVVLSSGDRITFNNTTVAVVQAALVFPDGGGTSGDDTLNGTSGDDTLNGLGGNDTINGLAGNDTLAGGSGADVIDGGDDDDTLYSGEASPPWSLPYYDNPYTPPLLDTGTEVDTLRGGAGSDIIFAGYGDNVDGGADGAYGDKLFISFQGAASGVTFDGSLATQVIGGGTITGIENISWIEGSEYDDYITVGAGNGYSDRTTVFGMGGNDTLIAGYYTGVLDGGDGNDIVDGRDSQYLQGVYGGSGNDTLYTNPNTFAVAYGGAGNDTIFAHGVIHGGEGDDTIHVVNSYYPGPVSGDDGNDTIYGSDAADQLDGGAGDDTLTGGAGDDKFIVGNGNDVITDFSAGDTVHIQAGFAGNAINQVGSDVVITLSSGNQLTFQNTNVATVTAALRANANDIAISPDGSTIYTAGDDGNLYIYDAETGELLHAWDVGIQLGGMDISADGTFAILVELQPLEFHSADPWWDNYSTAAVYKVDLATGQVTTYTTTLTAEQYAFYDVSILGNGEVLLTGQIIPGWSGWAPMQTLDLTTGQFTELPGTITASSVLTDDEAGALVGQMGISDARIQMYTAGSGVTAVHENYADDVQGFNNGVQAYSADVDLVAQNVGSALHIYDGQLQYQFDLGQLHPELTAGGVAGMAFSADGSFLFILNVGTDSIYQVSTSDWTIVAEFAVGVDISRAGGDFGNRLLVAPDMSYFTVVTDNGWVKVNADGTIGGTSGDDWLVGTDLDDTIKGFAGNDVLTGGPGNDLLDGGEGVDTASYAGALAGVTVSLTLSRAQNTVGAGTDTLVSIENVTGSAFADRLTGNSAANVLTGLDGDDVLKGNGGDDSLIGGEGADRLVGGPGSDTLEGGAGNDVLDGGFHADAMAGGAGDDRYYVDHAGDLVVELPGEGNDTVYSSIAYVLGANVENLLLTGTGSIYGTGNALDNLIVGNSGANKLYGLEGNDRLDGHEGNDTLDGGTGVDLMIGGTGNDIYYVDDARDNAKEEAGEGTDTVYASVSYTLRSNVENLVLTGTAAINGKGNELDNLIIGNSGANKLYGLDGNDRLDGHEGNDTLDGGAGVDLMIGGTGNDIYYVDDARDNAKEEAGEGTDTVYASVSYTLRSNVENLVLTGTAGLTGKGNELANAITGNSGANALYGLAGDDTLNGGGGNDILEGGAGADTMSGGAGADMFVFRDGDFGGMTPASADTILDFSQAEGDILRLDFVDANTALAGDQAFAFIGSGAFTGTAGELRYEISGGNTFVYGDTNGDGLADFMIALTGSHTLTEADFLI